MSILFLTAEQFNSITAEKNFIEAKKKLWKHSIITTIILKLKRFRTTRMEQSCEKGLRKRGDQNMIWSFLLSFSFSQVSLISTFNLFWFSSRNHIWKWKKLVSFHLLWENVNCVFSLVLYKWVLHLCWIPVCCLREKASFVQFDLGFFLILS